MSKYDCKNSSGGAGGVGWLAIKETILERYTCSRWVIHSLNNISVPGTGSGAGNIKMMQSLLDQEIQRAAGNTRRG